MKLRSKFCFSAFALVISVVGCKKEEPKSMSATSSAAAPTEKTSQPTPSTATSSASDTGASAETTAKLAGAAWALKQDEIKHDAKGQWAIQATASSTYGDAQGTAGWSANQATGAPNVDKYADDGNAWTSKTPDGGIEWLDLNIPSRYTPRRFGSVSHLARARLSKSRFSMNRVHHTPSGLAMTPRRTLIILMVKFPKTAFKTDHVKVTLATNVVPGWNEIDAVQLVGTDQ